MVFARAPRVAAAPETAAVGYLENLGRAASGGAEGAQRAACACGCNAAAGISDGFKASRVLAEDTLHSFPPTWHSPHPFPVVRPVTSRLRFDFSNNGAVEADKLGRVEAICRDWVARGLPVSSKEVRPCWTAETCKIWGIWGICKIWARH
jgi:hypothetical protein